MTHAEILERLHELKDLDRAAQVIRANGSDGVWAIVLVAINQWRAFITCALKVQDPADVAAALELLEAGAVAAARELLEAGWARPATVPAPGVVPTRLTMTVH